ncbi:hypothetical protein KCU93_g2002, partial [Aureobasidium melanogenum]
MATPVRNQSLELVDLPTEVLVEIFDHLPNKDLSTVRLVCNELCNAVTPRFAKVYFTEGFHVVSPYSINALVDITEHPVLGGYVKTVAICAARRTNVETSSCFAIVDEADRDAYIDAYVKTGRFARRMERVFSNIRSCSGHVVIKIFDEPGVSSLDGRVIMESQRLRGCHGYSQLTNWGSTTIAYQMVKTLEHTIYAARRARCSVKCLKIGLCGFHRRSIGEKLDAAMHKILESSLTPLSICLWSGHTRRISYDNESQRLEIQRIDFGGFSRHVGSNLPLQAAYTWLLTKSVTQLKIAHIQACEISRFRSSLAPRLTHLELENVYVRTENFNQSLWSEHIQMISYLPGLQHCRLSCLSYNLSLTSVPIVPGVNGTFQVMTLPSGRYPCRFRKFYLAFRDGTDSIEVSGNDVCNELKELGCYVATAEANKIQQIISDDCVSNDMVGIIDQVEDRSTIEETALS